MPRNFPQEKDSEGSGNAGKQRETQKKNCTRVVRFIRTTRAHLSRLNMPLCRTLGFIFRPGQERGFHVTIARYTKWHASERSHARMLRFDWLIRRVGSCVASIRMCAEGWAPSFRPFSFTPHCTTLRRIRAIIGFSRCSSPFFRPFEMAGIAIPRKASSRETRSPLWL